MVGPAQPDHARLVQLLQICRLLRALCNPWPSSCRQIARWWLSCIGELGRSPTAPHRPKQPVAHAVGGQGRIVYPVACPRHAIGTAVTRSRIPGRWLTRLTAADRGEPGAWRRARRFGERPAETDRWQHRHRAAGRLNHPGAQLRFTDIDGMRVTAFITDTTRGGARPAGGLEPPPPPARPRRGPHPARQSRRPAQPALPRFLANAAWLEIVLAAADLVAGPN